jgi:hypothetical protein
MKGIKLRHFKRKSKVNMRKSWKVTKKTTLYL